MPNQSGGWGLWVNGLRGVGGQGHDFELFDLHREWLGVCLVGREALVEWNLEAGV